MNRSIDPPDGKYKQVSKGFRQIPIRPRLGADSAVENIPEGPVHAHEQGSAATLCGIILTGMHRWDRDFTGSIGSCRVCADRAII